MTIILSPPAPGGSDVAAVAASNDTRPPSDRAVTFGPTLSDAQQRLASPDARRADPSERQPTADRRSDRSDRGAEHVVDRSTERPAGADTADVSVERSAEESADEEPASDDTATAARNPTPTADGSAPNAPSAATLAMAATLHPTAKGAVGAGDPSIDPTIEAVAAPDPIAAIAEVDTTSIADRVTSTNIESVDIEGMPSTVVDAAKADTAQMGRQAASTSLEQVSDVALGPAERTGPATTDEVAGPSTPAGKATRADPLASVPSESTAEPIVQGRIEETNAERSRASEVDAAMSVDEPADPAMADVSAVESEAVDRPVQQTTIGTVARSDTPDSAVVLAREATAVADAAKAAPATTTPVPVPAAEANLWEDVRSAFDRIRSTGDGQEVRIRLRPAELGELLVQVRTQGDHVSVRLVASSAAAQQTLIDDRLRLAAELARAGFDEGSVDIDQQNTGDSSRSGDERSDGSGADHPRQSLGNVVGLDRAGPTREIFERRDPIRTEIGFRPGRNARSTINLTL